ncbi:MAG: hypothetical protein HYT11_03860 [Candidatus Levybacteria bacterium]|nr:hypothetical protein [Candidatus Levybacteria bacterium]
MIERRGQPQTILDRLQALMPDNDVVFAAIEKLHNPDEIRQFRNEYEEFIRLRAHDGETRQQIADIANNDIGFVLGFYTDRMETVRMWFKTLGQISHPEFGRNLPDDLWKYYVSF